MNYLNWQQLKDALNAVTDPRLLAEPALFVFEGAFGQNVYPMQWTPESIHPGEQRVLSYDEEADNYEVSHHLDLEQRQLRQLPPGALLLYYCQTDDEVQEGAELLAQSNPHTPPPPPAVPGPAPLFE